MQLSILNLFFDGGGLPPALPQITFATHSQTLLSKSAGKRRLGTSELGISGPVRSPPARGGISCPLPPGHLPSWNRSGGLAGRQKRNVASRVSRLDARLGWGCSGAHAGARGGRLRERSDEKRGYPASPDSAGPCYHSQGALSPQQSAGQCCWVWEGGREGRRAPGRSAFAA